MPQHVLETPEPRPATPEHSGRLEVAALVETRTHTAGVGWRLTLEGTAGPPRSRTLRRAATLASAELAALREGLRAASRAGCRTLRVDVPDRRIVALLRREPTVQFRRARAVIERLEPILQGFESVQFDFDFARDRELAHAVGEALDAGLHAAAAREQHRAFVMERIIDRARAVHLQRTDSGWLANDRYRVQLDPMRCECPAWTARWASTPIGARRAQRLPCKHIVALALHEGISVPSDLAALARRAPA